LTKNCVHLPACLSDHIWDKIAQKMKITFRLSKLIAFFDIMIINIIGLQSMPLGSVRYKTTRDRVRGLTQVNCFAVVFLLFSPMRADNTFNWMKKSQMIFCGLNFNFRSTPHKWSYYVSCLKAFHSHITILLAEPNKITPLDKSDSSITMITRTPFQNNVGKQRIISEKEVKLVHKGHLFFGFLDCLKQ